MKLQQQLKNLFHFLKFDSTNSDKILIHGQAGSGKSTGPVSWFIKYFSEKKVPGLIIQFKDESFGRLTNSDLHTYFFLESRANDQNKSSLPYYKFFDELPANSFVYCSVEGINDPAFINKILNQNKVRVILESQSLPYLVEHLKVNTSVFSQILSNGDIRRDTLKVGSFKNAGTKEIYMFDDQGNSAFNKMDHLSLN